MDCQNNSQKSIAVSAGLNIVRQLAMIAFPLITYSYATRVLGAKGIGVYEYAQSIINYFALIAALGVVNYAVREGAKYRNKRDDISRFASEVFSINLIMTVISYVIMALCFMVSSQMNSYRTAIMLMSISILFTTLGVDWINSLFEDYLPLTIRYIAIQMTALIMLFVFVRTPEDIYRYILISIMATVINGILNFFYVRKYVDLRFTFALNLKSHALPVFILFCNQIALVIYLNSDITILNYLTDDTSVGIYGVAAKIYTMIKTLINAAIFVVIPRFSEYVINEDKRFVQGLRRLLSPLFTVLLPACVGLFFFSKEAAFIVSGKGFEDSRYPLSILAIALFFAVLACYFANAIIMPCKLEKYFLISTVIAAVINIVLNFVLIPKMGMIAAAITTLIAEFLVFILLIIVASTRIKLRDIIELRDTVSATVGSICVGILSYLSRSIFAANEGMIITFAKIVIILLIYCVILLAMKNSAAVKAIEIIKFRLRKSKS